jgi:hypothetical protein
VTLRRRPPGERAPPRRWLDARAGAVDDNLDDPRAKPDKIAQRLGITNRPALAMVCLDA